MCEKDIPAILKLWSTEKKVLGIPFRKTITDLIHDQHFFGIFDEDNNLIAMCAYKIMRRQPQIRIAKLCVHKKYRKQGKARAMIMHILIDTKMFTLPVIAKCMDGAENNLFYDHIGTLLRIEERKTMRVRFYEIDKHGWSHEGATIHSD